MRNRNPRVTRRIVLRGLGGVALGLPLLESWPRKSLGQAQAAPGDPEPYAIFFRQGAGIACEQRTDVGSEPERFWPRQAGTLDDQNVADRALDELGPYLSRTLLLKVNKNNFSEYADGHANGAQQSLTGRGPTADTSGNSGKTEADGESLDHRIGAELNPDGRDSLYLYTGPDGGWLGGACLSYRSSGQRRAAQRNPFNAYQSITGGAGGLSPEVAELLAKKQKSVNDVVRQQLDELMNSPVTSSADRERLDLHFTAVRELEVALSCQLSADQEAMLESGSSVFDSVEHDDVVATTRLHAEVAALAVACGHTRSVTIQLGTGNSGMVRFRNPDTNELMDNYHYISHRIQSHGGEGTLIQGSDLLHHYIDRYHAQMFRHLLDKLDAYSTPNGAPLLDHGVSIWFNDNGNGPGHSVKNVPYALVGSCGGVLKQGQYLELDGEENLCQVLNTIGTAVGLTSGDGDAMEDFGDPAMAGGVRSEMLA